METAERMTSKDMENTGSYNKHLFDICMKGEWGEMVKRYEEDKKAAHKAIITKSGDTALHVAVTDGQEDAVEQLVEMVKNETPEALRIQNERKNTALHFAASMGSARMIECIADADPSLVSVRNVDGETPLFLAALNGRKDAFMILHSVCHKDPNTPIKYENCRRNDGDTVLHSAINGDYFDLAFQIIHLYGDLVNCVNENGDSPLHLLASKPSAFRSGTRFGRVATIIYYGILVEELKPDPSFQLSCKADEKNNSYPENYKACVDVATVIKNAILVVTNWSEKFRRKDQPRTQSEVDSEAPEHTAANNGSEGKTGSHPLFPANWVCCVDFLKFIYIAMLVIFGRGATKIEKMRRRKEKHVWSVQIMNELLNNASMYEYEYDGSKPSTSVLGDDETSPYCVNEVDSNTAEQQPSTTKGEVQQQNKEDKKDTWLEKRKKTDTPILIAAKNGVTEMVERILDLFPVAVHDMDVNKKNIVLLAIENRQPHMFELLSKRKVLKESLFRKVDKEGNSALHLAAKYGDSKPWLIPGAALQMHWEIKWYLFVKESMPPHFFRRYNNKYQTPKEIFTETHKDLVKSGGEWLKQTSGSCSVVASLIATVAFATSSSVPGGVHEKTGIPTFENETAFKVFAIASLIALCCSVTSVVQFLSILTSRFQEYDFGKNLPRKLILGLTTLFVSIGAMMVSFCAGHFLVLRNKLRYAALPIYAVTTLPVTLFALAQFPLYFDLIWATFKEVPLRSYKHARF